MHAIETFQKAVVDCSLHKPVLEAVERHSIHEILVESALEILIILTQNSESLFFKTQLYMYVHSLSIFNLPENLQPVLNEADALGATVSIMKKHVVSPCKLVILYVDLILRTSSLDRIFFFFFFFFI